MARMTARMSSPSWIASASPFQDDDSATFTTAISTRTLIEGFRPALGLEEIQIIKMCSEVLSGHQTDATRNGHL